MTDKRVIEELDRIMSHLMAISAWSRDLHVEIATLRNKLALDAGEQITPIKTIYPQFANPA